EQGRQRSGIARQAGERRQALHRPAQLRAVVQDSGRGHQGQPEEVSEGRDLLEERVAKSKGTSFFCTTCGHEEPRWFGRCPACQAWNTASEAPPAGAARARGGRHAGPARWTPRDGPSAAPRELSSVEIAETPRRSTGLPELDRVLGGGLVSGSLVLV